MTAEEAFPHRQLNVKWQVHTGLSLKSLSLVFQHSFMRSGTMRQCHSQLHRACLQAIPQIKSTAKSTDTSTDRSTDDSTGDSTGQVHSQVYRHFHRQFHRWFHRQFHRQFYRRFHRQFHRQFHRPGPQTKPKNDSTASSFLIFLIFWKKKLNLLRPSRRSLHPSPRKKQQQLATLQLKKK